MTDDGKSNKVVTGSEKTGDGRGFQPFVVANGERKKLPGRYQSEIDARRAAEAFCKKEGLL